MNNKKEKDYKWGRGNFKIGWQYPSEFWDSLSDEDKEWPFSVTLPKEYRPEKKIDLVRVLKFNHLIEFFKKEIEFKRNGFKDQLENMVANKTDWNFRYINIDSVDFYTYTTNVLTALNRMINNLIDRSFPECEFEITDKKAATLAISGVFTSHNPDTLIEFLQSSGELEVNDMQRNRIVVKSAE